MNKKIFIQLLGILSYALTQWLLVIFLVHMYGVDSSAQYIYYLAFFTPLSIFFSYGLRNGIASDKKYTYEFPIYLKVLYLGIFLYVIFGIILFYFLKQINLYIFTFVFLLKLNEMISEPYYGNFLRENKSQKYAFSKIYKFICGLLFFSIFCVLEIKSNLTYLSLLGYIFAIYLIYFIYDSKFNNIEKNTTNTQVFYDLLITNFPLAIGGFVIAFNSSIPKIIFGWDVQSTALAIFGFLIYFNSIALLPITAFTQIAFGRKNIDSFWYFQKKLIIYSLIYIISFLIFVPFVLQYFYSIEDGYNIVSLILAALCGVFQFNLALNNFFLTYNRFFNINLYVALIGSALNIAFCFAFIHLGLNGILFAVMLSSLISLLFSLFLRESLSKKTLS